jgi:hypothetical protein
MQSYQTIRGHSADFIVKYRLYATADGGRKVTFQHLRCDFMYEGDDPQTDGVWMIHPEFLDESGDPIQDSNPVALDGKASMWILFPQHRKATHSLRAKIGVRGHFMEGARKVGDVEIIEIVDLYKNTDN